MQYNEPPLIILSTENKAVSVIFWIGAYRYADRCVVIGSPLMKAAGDIRHSKFGIRLGNGYGIFYAAAFAKEQSSYVLYLLTVSVGVGNKHSFYANSWDKLVLPVI